MDYDLDYYGGRDLQYPKTPVKPRLDPKADSTTAMTYAQALAVYESAMISYREQRDEYTRSINGRYYELKTRLRDDHDITDAQMHLLWGKAYEDGHSEGLHRVVALFEELYEIASQFAVLEG